MDLKFNHSEVSKSYRCFFFITNETENLIHQVLETYENRERREQWDLSSVDFDPIVVKSDKETIKPRFKHIKYKQGTNNKTEFDS